jgi:hypothetical protein
MAKADHVGHSEETAVKQAQVRIILHEHMRQVQHGIMAYYDRKGYPYHPEYLYWDLHAGPGINVDGAPGSPLIALETAALLGLPLEAGLFERNPETGGQLWTAVAESCRQWPSFRGHWRVIVGDHNTTVPERLAAVPQTLQARAYGLVYSDSNGEVVNVPLLRQIATTWQLKRLDFLLYIGANAQYKRARGPQRDDARFLQDDLAALGKPYVWIREPRTAWQWTFVLASSYARLNVPGWLGFHRLDSARGRDILWRLNWSKYEQRHLAAAIRQLPPERALPLLDLLERRERLEAGPPTCYRCRGIELDETGRCQYCVYVAAHA